MCTALVVLPTPPFWFPTAMMCVFLLIPSMRPPKKNFHSPETPRCSDIATINIATTPNFGSQGAIANPSWQEDFSRF